MLLGFYGLFPTAENFKQVFNQIGIKVMMLCNCYKSKQPHFCNVKYINIFTDMSSWETLRDVSSKVVRPPNVFTMTRDHDDDFYPTGERFEQLMDALNHDDDYVSQETAITIAAVAASIAFALMTLVFVILSCQHQKQIAAIASSLM